MTLKTKISTCGRRLEEEKERALSKADKQKKWQLQWRNTFDGLCLSLDISDRSAIESQRKKHQFEIDAWQATLLSLQQTEKKINTAKATHLAAKDCLTAKKNQWALLNKDHQSALEKQADIEKRTQILMHSQQEKQAALWEDLSKYVVIDDASVNLSMVLATLSNRMMAWQSQTEKQVKLTEDIVALNLDLSLVQSEIANLTVDCDALSATLATKKIELQGMLQALTAQLGSASLAQWWQGITDEYQTKQTIFEASKNTLQESQRALAMMAKIIERHQHSHRNLKEEHQTRENAWADALNASPFSMQTQFESALIDEVSYQALLSLKKDCDAVQQRMLASWTHWRSLENTWENHINANEWRLTSKVSVIEKSAFEQQKYETLLAKIGALEERQKAQLDKEKTQKSAIIYLEEYRQYYDDMAALNGLIGSQNGNKFRQFAQGLTLDHLINLANNRLILLHDRYLLARQSNENLTLVVQDRWQGDQSRDTRTLSGGESFLVSLALALALSDLVSHKTQIDSLFLDEGFGTLDSATLDVALAALDNLHASGKLVGVISHVEALKDRIPVQIQVQKHAGTGFSRLDSCFQGN
jgi:exonuclease SbcC